MKKKIVFLVLAISLVLFSCKKTMDKTDMKETAVVLKIPQFFPKMNIPVDNKMTVERIALGRMLYNDPILSNNGKSCSSCHFQSKGFTTEVSSGTTVLPHINLGWNTNFLWKGEKQCSLEDMMMFEVNEFFGSDISKLNENEEYRLLFHQAYGVNTIVSKDVAYALAQFFRTIISGNSRYDQYRRREFPLTASEMRGMQIFFSEKGDCFHCHAGSLFTDNDFHNIGLDSVLPIFDKGRYDVTGITSDAGKYKTPTLRNSGLRAQFMHDGRFTTLEEVVEFYNSGFHQKSPNIDPLMLLPEKENGLNLTTQEKSDLVGFLKTLTDYAFITDSSLSKP
jgi:cytochrome c peroxidase